MGPFAAALVVAKFEEKVLASPMIGERFALQDEYIPANSGSHPPTSIRINVKNQLRTIAVDILGLAGAYPTRLTDGHEVRKLIEKLKPRTPSVDFIRLGPHGDGGYVLPNDLDGIEACFSPGVGGISGFEVNCADRGMQVFLADKSVDGPAVAHEKFRFIKKYIGAVSSDDYISVRDWVASSIPSAGSDLMLQIDIEGYEYQTFLAMPDELFHRFRIIVAEFHWLDQLWSRAFFSVASPAFEKILQTHTCVHIHPNNYSWCAKRNGVCLPDAMEFTFLRNDRMGNAPRATKFPHPLDSDNAAHLPPLPLPTCWFGE